MIRNILLTGVGGQGLLTLAGIIGEAAVSARLHLKQSEVHGMAQRGGGVESHLRYGDRPIHSDLIREGTADLILALEPMEGLRYVRFLAPSGILVANRSPFVNIPDYPNESAIYEAIEALPHHRLIDAAALAEEAGAVQSANMVMLGAGSPFLELPEPALLDSIRAAFASKPASVIETNLVAFHLGRRAASESPGT